MCVVAYLREGLLSKAPTDPEIFFKPVFTQYPYNKDLVITSMYLNYLFAC